MKSEVKIVVQLS